MDVLQIKNLSFAYPPQEDGQIVNAIKNINLTVSEGEFLILCGVSGSGKSTLLKLIKPQLSPKGELEGEIYLSGKQVSQVDACSIGFVAQNPDSQIVTDKVWHELAFGLENMGIPTEKMQRIIAEMASCFGLEKQYKSDTSVLSGGEKQLLNLAGVLAMEPKLLLLDEPTSQLDPISASRFLNILKKLNEEWGCTIIMAEHRLEECIPLADRLVVLKNGEIISVGKAEDMYQAVSLENLGQSFPAAMQLAAGLGETKLPVTVKEGRTWLKDKLSDNSNIKPIAVKKEKKGAQLLSAKDLWFTYERNAPYILKNADIALNEGEILAVLGGNGTGKSTLLSVLGGGRKAQRGKVKSTRPGVVTLPQNPLALFTADTVGEEYDLFLSGFCKASEAEKRKNQVVEDLDIAHLLSRNPYDLSGGEQQLCALGKVCLTKPSVLLLDEPTKGMDVSAKNKVLSVLRELAEKGCGILIVTHDVCIAAESDKCALFFDGKLTPPQEVHSFFAGNNYYTPPINRIARGICDMAVTVDELLGAIR